MKEKENKKIRIGLHEDRKQVRTNLWTIVFYPGDSAPKNYLSLLQDLHIEMLLSPIHDKDLNASLLEKKKHQHLLINYGSGQKKSYDQVLKIANMLGVKECDYVDSRDALVRYFIHADIANDPYKKQYEKKDFIALSGFDYERSFNGIDSDDQIYTNIENIIIDHFICNSYVLRNVLIKQNMMKELSFYRRHTIYFKYLMDGVYQHINKVNSEKKENDQKDKKL